jgi:hypothetical protein
MAKKRNSGKPKSRFAIGDRVRVRPGLRDPDFPDVPIGGWVGTVEKVASGRPPMISILWIEETLQQIHPICQTRSELRGLDATRMDLYEEDLEPYDGAPVVLEQPTEIVPLPLDPQDPEDRIRAVFNRTSDDELPWVSYESNCVYRGYLTKYLAFPFPASIAPNESATVTGDGFLILRMSDSDEQDDVTGLFCELRRVNPANPTADPRWADECNRQHSIPIRAARVAVGDPNALLLSDYDYWLREYSQ